MVSLAPPNIPAAAQSAKSSGSSRKRDISRVDGEEEIQSKRLKVAFDPHVEVQFMEDWNEKGLELVKEEVRQALRRHTGALYLGEDVDKSSGYDQIKQLFSKTQGEDEPPSTSTLRKYLIALTGNVSLLNKSCSGLVHAVLDSDWLGRDETYIVVYLRFLGSLVSAHGAYISTVLKMLVEKFTGGKYPLSVYKVVAHNSQYPPTSAGFLTTQW